MLLLKGFYKVFQLLCQDFMTGIVEVQTVHGVGFKALGIKT